MTYCEGSGSFSERNTPAASSPRIFCCLATKAQTTSGVQDEFVQLLRMGFRLDQRSVAPEGTNVQHSRPFFRLELTSSARGLNRSLVHTGVTFNMWRVSAVPRRLSVATTRMDKVNGSVLNFPRALSESHSLRSGVCRGGSRVDWGASQNHSGTSAINFFSRYQKNGQLT